MTLVCKSHGIGNNIFNPIYEGGDKINPDIGNNVLTLFMMVGLKQPQILTLNVVRCIGLVLTILKRYDNCIKISWYLEIIYLTLFMRVGIK